MDNASSHEEIAVVVIITGCGAAVAFAVVVLICCHVFGGKSKTRGSARRGRTVIFERQATTSEDNNGEMFSCCYEESSSQPQDFYEESEAERSASWEGTSTPATDGPSQGAYQPPPTPNKPGDQSPTAETSFAQVNNRQFVTHNGKKSSKTSRSQSAIVEANTEPETPSKSRSQSDPHSKAIAGIHRQMSFDVPDEECANKVVPLVKHLTVHVKNDSVESEEDRSPETLRKQYKDLWQLRATFEAEEEVIEASTSHVVNEHEKQLEKLDSGYKSLEERKDYSIDYKSESIYRQFTSTTSNAGDPFAARMSHQSIEEEDLANQQPIYV